MMIIILLAGCSSDDGGGGVSTSQQLTVDYVKRELQIEGFATSGATVIYDSESQGSDYEFTRVVVSKVSNAEGESLAYAYSLVHPSLVDYSRFVAFYIDVDNNPGTGQLIEGIGADRLLLDTTIFESSTFSWEYFIWSEGQSQWFGQDVNGLSTSIISEEANGTLSINVPYYVNIEDLLGLTGAKGIFAVRTFENGDPNDINATTQGATAVFTFNTPM